MVENEKELLEKTKKGDILAFEKLIESCQKKVFNIAFRILGNHDDASELSQEVFIRIYKSINNFKEDSSFSTWVYRITTNICLDEIRRRKNKKVLYLDDEIKTEDGEIHIQIEDDKPRPDEIVEKREAGKAITNAINLLSPEHRTAVVLRDVQGFSYEEIALILKCPQGTVKSRINRARLELREILKKSRELFNKDYVK